MKQFEIKKEEMDKWLDSKNLKDGFFTVETDSNNSYYQEYSEDDKFIERTIIYYYEWVKELKMGSLLDVPDDYSYFDYLLNNDYIKLMDTLTVSTFEWINSEEREEEFNDFNNDRSYIYEKYNSKSGDYPIKEYSRIRESEIMENFEKFWTYNWGYFNAKAPLEEQENFMAAIIDELKRRWLLESEEETFTLELYSDEENWGIEYIFNHLKEKGSKIYL